MLHMELNSTEESCLDMGSRKHWNRNISKYQLPLIWDEVLINSAELKLK